MSKGDRVLAQKHCNNCILFQNKSPQVKFGMSLCNSDPGKTSKQKTLLYLSTLGDTSTGTATVNSEKGSIMGCVKFKIQFLGHEIH